MNKQEQFEQSLDEALEHANDVRPRASLPRGQAELVATRNRLNVLKDVPELPPQAIAAKRTEFMLAARALRMRCEPPSLLRRLWAFFVPPAGSRKRLPVLLSRTALAVTLVVLLVGASVGSAMAAAPDSPFYGLKTALEDARMSLTPDPLQRAQLALSLALERTQEIEQMARNGQSVDSSLIQRLQQHLNTALENASRLGNSEKAQFLAQLINQIQAQLQNTTMVQTDASAMNQETLRTMAQAWQQTRLRAQQAQVGNGERNGNPAATPRPLRTTRTPQPQADVTPFPGNAGLNRAVEAISESLQYRQGLATVLPVTATEHMQTQHGMPTATPASTVTPPVQARAGQPTEPPAPGGTPAQTGKPTGVPSAAIQSHNSTPAAKPTMRPAPTQVPADTPMPSPLPNPTAHPDGYGQQPTPPAGQGTGHGR